MATIILRMDEGDDLVDEALARLKKKYASAPVITWRQVVKVGKAKKGDVLIILGHGDSSELGGKSARELAAAFAKADMPSGVTIDLVACDSGKGGAPLALELKTQLVSAKIVPEKVTGGTNLMWVRKDGRAFTRGDDAREAKSGRETVATPWGDRTRNNNSTYRTGR